MEEKKTKVVMVLAHPDDEIIFGWPIFQDDDYEKEIIMCSSDFNNPARQQYAHRKFLLQEVCEKYNIPLTCFDYPSEFYKLETRGTTLEDMQNTIVDCVNSKECDYVFTHNPMGEYGMIDHKMLFELMYTRVDKPLLITDLLQYETHWPSHHKIPRRIEMDFYKHKLFDCELNVEMYTDIYNIYNKGNAWTYWRTPETETKKCSLYKIY
jgi:LmbE family N-acetylglucosaminyl deacetylase